MSRKDFSSIDNLRKSSVRNVDGPIFIGRSWSEYMKMFGIDLDDVVDEKILDCAAGASSFTAIMSKMGFDVKAVDIIYNETPDVLLDKCRYDMELLVEGLKCVDHFVWGFFRDVEDLKQQRKIACEEFINDYRMYKGQKYVSADLNSIPFEDNSFSIVLCSHLLFIYDHRLSYDFHLDVIKEMLRVSSNELRIYPLVKSHGKKSVFVEQIIKDLPDVDMEFVKVDYEFRKGGNEMLKLVK